VDCLFGCFENVASGEAEKQNSQRFQAIGLVAFAMLVHSLDHLSDNVKVQVILSKHSGNHKILSKVEVEILQTGVVKLAQQLRILFARQKLNNLFSQALFDFVFDGEAIGEAHVSREGHRGVVVFHVFEYLRGFQHRASFFV